MKKFNKVIQVEVAVDNIAENLLSTMIGNHPHREMIVETIIGTANNMQLSMLYNSLNGYTNDINFTIGQGVKPTKFRAYSYSQNDAGEWKQEYVDVVEATVNDINIYADHKLEILFNIINSKGQPEKRTTWIKHTDCELIVESLALVE